MSYKERLPEFNKRQEESSVKALVDTIKRVSDSDHRDFLLKQEVWNNFVLPKIELINKSGVKELLEDVRKDVWTVGEINGFGLSFDDLKIERGIFFLNEADVIKNWPIGYSLMVNKPRFMPERIASGDYDQGKLEYIYSESYGFTVSLESYSSFYNKKEIEGSNFRIRYENPKLPNGFILEDISKNSSPTEVQDAIVEIWEKSKQTLPFLINFANEPIDKDVISAVKRGVEIPKKFKDILERYR